MATRIVKVTVERTQEAVIEMYIDTDEYAEWLTSGKDTPAKRQQFLESARDVHADLRSAMDASRKVSWLNSDPQIIAAD